jgi:hypothetical protein
MNKEKWEKLSFAAQMGNIGSEINRVIHWQELRDKGKKEDALWRALELIDLTAEQRKSSEILRLREVVCDLFLEKNIYKVSVKSLKDYFLQFALLMNK